MWPWGLPTWLSGKEPACQCWRSQFDPWVGKIPWRRKWKPTPVFLPGKSYGQRSLEGYSPWDHKNSHTRLSDSVKFSRSVVSDSVTAWTSMPGFPIHHQLLEPIQTHVHRVGDAIQLPHLLSSPFPPALNLSQHQGLFHCVRSSHQVTRVLEPQLQHQSFQ